MKLYTILAGLTNLAVVAAVASVATQELKAEITKPQIRPDSITTYAPTTSIRPKLRPDSKQISCLATNIYFEARSQSREGQVAVAQVTMNRAAHSNWPLTVCDVVWQPNQFSWTHDGKSDRPKNLKLYNDILNIAKSVYIGIEPNIVGDSTFYHADYVNPSWAEHKSMSLTDRIGDHLFYTWTGDWN